MSETGPEVYTPENTTPSDSPEQPVNVDQPASIETLPPPNDIATGTEEVKEAVIGDTIRGGSGWKNMSKLDNLSIANSQAPAPEVQSPDFNSEAPAAELPGMTDQERIEKGKDLIGYQAELTYDITNPENVKFSPEQEKNNEITEGLLEKYPHAFIERLTDDGRKYLLLKRIEGGGPDYPGIFSRYLTSEDLIREGKALMFSYWGVAVMNLVEDPAKYDFMPLLDNGRRKVTMLDDDIHLKRIQENDQIHGSEDAVISKFECKSYDNVAFGTLKKILIDMEQSHKNDIIREKRTAQELLALL